jgi:hypothetical protein
LAAFEQLAAFGPGSVTPVSILDGSHEHRED